MGEDYFIPETITFASGEDTAYITVRVVNDFSDEDGAETFVLELNPGPSGTVVGLARTTVLILDDDEGNETDDDDDDDDDTLGKYFIAMTIIRTVSRTGPF